MTQIQFDEELLARLEVAYQARDVQRRRALVRDALAPAPGQRILDVGCGPGFYVSELADIVGPDGHVMGVDASEQSVAVARRRCDGRDNVSFAQADATDLGVEPESFDAALSVQVLEYVSDVPAALVEIHRALRPGGRVVLWDVDWSTFSVHAEDVARNDRVLEAWDAHLADPWLPRRLKPMLVAAGFENVAVEGHLFLATDDDPQTYAAMLLSFIPEYVARQGLEEDGAAWHEEQQALMARGEFFSAVVQFCFSATRP